jgi:hypothetical protein
MSALQRSLPQLAQLTGDHCVCPTCKEAFNSSKAFDQHRVGWFSGLRRIPSMRRCLGASEMDARGMRLGRHGWLTRRRRR